MTELKTKPTNKSIDDFLKKVENPTKREDSLRILELMKEITQEKPVMWGDSIVGFGSYHYKYSQTKLNSIYYVGLRKVRKTSRKSW